MKTQLRKPKISTGFTLVELVIVIIILAWRLELGSNKPLLATVLLTFGLQMATIYVPFLNPIFKTEPLSLSELAVCLSTALIVWIAVELEKAWRRTRRSSFNSEVS